MGAVIALQAINRKDYDEKFPINDKEVSCYSKNALKKKYPDGNYYIVGETFEKNKKEKIAVITLGGKDLTVSGQGTNWKLCYQSKGFVEVGKNAYIALLKSRIPFVLLCGGLLFGSLVAAIITLVLWLTTPALTPDYVIPAEDDLAENMEDDDSKKMDSKNGGGAVSLNYSLAADIDLSSGHISMLLQNPNASNKDMVVTLYIQSGETETPIARSGLVKSGKELKSMVLNLDGVRLEKGKYTGYFLLDFYEPDSGEKSMMNSRIDNVEITTK